MHINDYALVRLTDEGLAHYTSSLEEIGMTKDQVKECLRISVLSDGRHQFPIWELMSTFGSEMYMGNTKQMFVDNIIEFVPF